MKYLAEVSQALKMGGLGRKKNSEVEAAIYRHIARQNPIYIIYIPFFKARLTSARYFITTLPLQYILQDYFQ